MIPRRLHPQTRDFELFLFGGAPTLPEPVFERIVSSHMESTTTRADDGQSDYALTGKDVESVEIDFEAETVLIEQIDG